jgi:hypothetical protein
VLSNRQLEDGDVFLSLHPAKLGRPHADARHVR